MNREFKMIEVNKSFPELLGLPVSDFNEVGK